MAVVSDYTSILAYLDGDYYRWNATHKLGFPVFVSYSFLTASALPSIWETDYPVSWVGVMSPAQQAAVRSAMAQIEATAGIRFVETTGEAMINAYSVSGSGYGGWAEYPYASSSYTSNGIYVMDVTYGDNVAGDGFGNVLHELGHALGLSHPHEGDLTLSAGLDSRSFSIMSYNWEYYPVATLGPLDTQALRHIYGEASQLSGLTYAFNTAGVFTVAGTSGADRIMGLQGDNLLKGGAGNDVLVGREGNDKLLGGAGSDVLYGHGGVDLLKGGKGNDRMYSNVPGTKNIYDPGQHRMEGGLGNDRMYGGSGADTMLGGSGQDTIRGGGGSDRLIGGKGLDKLYGQAGSDVFRFDPKRDGDRDIVMDFNPLADALEFAGARFDRADFSFVALANGSGSVLRLDAGAAEPFKVLFRDVSVADLRLYFDSYHDYF